MVATNDSEQIKNNSSVSPSSSFLIVKNNEKNQKKLVNQENVDLELGLDDHFANRNF